MTVDTLSIAKELRAAELPPSQAKAIAAAIGRSVLEGAATKADFGQLRTDFKADLGQLRTGLKSDLAQLEARDDAKFDQLRVTMMTWFIGSTLTITAIVIAALKL